MANKKISELPLYTGTSQTTGELAIAVAGTTYKITPQSLGISGASTAYVDAKIEDALVDGVTTKAPSQNAVVDALSNKEPLIPTGAVTQYFKGGKTWATLDKTAVGLANVDNTSDVDKPISSAVTTALGDKEDKSNKSTSTSLGTSDTLYPTQNAVKTYVDGVVTPDATTTIKGKIKLAGDLSGTADAPTVLGLTNKVDKEVGKSLFSGSYADLTDKPTIPAAQVQSDWEQTTTTALDFIKNKPTIPSITGLATEAYVDAKVEDVITDGVTSKAPSQNAVFDALALKENTIAPGTTSQYFRGDKTWQEFPAPNVEPLEFNIADRTVWNNGKRDLVTNTCFGFEALTSYNPAPADSDAQNTCFGYRTLKNSIDGAYITAIGANALTNTISGWWSTAIGSRSLMNVTTGAGNTAIGASSLAFITTGYDNIAIGKWSGTLTPSSDYNTSSNSSIFIGNTTRVLDNNQTNQIIIGHEAIGAGSNTATLGNTDIEKTILRGKISIGTTTPEGILDVSSTTTGSLPFPRMTSVQRTDIVSPAIGMHVYQTDGIEGVYVKKSTGWQLAY
jgi:hypothetical protein